MQDSRIHTFSTVADIEIQNTKDSPSFSVELLSTAVISKTFWFVDVQDKERLILQTSSVANA